VREHGAYAYAHVSEATSAIQGHPLAQTFASSGTQAAFSTGPKSQDRTVHRTVHRTVLLSRRSKKNMIKVEGRCRPVLFVQRTVYRTFTTLVTKEECPWVRLWLPAPPCILKFDPYLTWQYVHNTNFNHSVNSGKYAI